MAATDWALYNEAKKYIGDGGMTLGSNIWTMQLHQTGSNATTLTLSIVSELTSEVASGNGYTTGGNSLLSQTWAAGRSAQEHKWDFADPVWTASGGTIPNISLAVITRSTNNYLMCFSRLTTAQFTLGDGNTLTIQLDAALGVFVLL